jgi:Bacterial membrane protein YfhO
VKPWLLASLLLVVLLLVSNYPLLVGRAAPNWDAADFFGPQFSLVSDHARHGRLLMWNPWVAAGSPDFAEPEFGTTSPLLLFIALLIPHPEAGFLTYWFLLWAIGSVGMLFLARYFGAPLWAALVVALGYTASGFYIGHAEHTSSICSIAYLPWILLLFDKALRQHAYWPAVQAGILYGLSALGGYPMFTIVTPGFLALWALGRAWPAKTFAHAAIALMISVGIGALVCSPAYFAFLNDTHGYSDRIGPRSRIESTSSNVLPVGALSTLSSPYLALENSDPHHLWPESDISMVGVYFGVLPLAFALAGIRRYPWVALLALFFLACALGNQLPLRGWLYDLLPPTRYFRNPALFREYVILLLCILASLAAQHWPSIRRALLPVSIALAISAFLAFFITVHGRAEIPDGITFALSHLAIVWIALVVVAYFRNSHAMVGLAIFDFVATIVISWPMLFTTATLPWWQTENREHSAVLDLSQHGLDRISRPPERVGDYPQSRNVTLKIAVFDTYVTMTNRFHAQFVQDPALSSLALGSDRIWFSSNPVSMPASDQAFTLFKDAVDRNSAAPPLVLHTTEAQNAGALSGSSGKAAITDLSYRANSLAFHYQAPSAGWLMITDRWATGWQATVNGVAAPILRADFIFRAVHVNLGPNTIEMRYKPKYFAFTLALSWGTLAALAALQLRRTRHG